MTGITVSVKRNNILVKECGIINLRSSLYHKDQIYTVYCDVMGDEIFLENKKGDNIIFLEVAAYSRMYYFDLISKQFPR